MTVVSVLRLPVRPGSEDALVHAFAELEIFRHSERERRLPGRAAPAPARRRAVPRGRGMGERRAYQRLAREPHPRGARRADRAAAHRRRPGRRAVRGRVGRSPASRQRAARRSARRPTSAARSRTSSTSRPTPRPGVQEVVTAKSDTTPPDFERGVMNVMAKGGVPLGEIAFLAHGTTVVINALTERKGVKTALITTEGFRDSLEIARGNRPDFFNLALRQAAAVRAALPPARGSGPTHPRRASSARPLDLAGLPAIVDGLPRRRRRGGRDLPAPLLRQPDARAGGARAACASSGRRSRPSPRTRSPASGASTSGRAPPCCRPTSSRSPSATSAGSPTALATRRLRRPALRHAVELRRRLGREDEARSRSRWSSRARRAAFWGAAELGRLIGDPNVLALDIGGTTAKCSLIEGGHVKIITDYWIERSRQLGRLPDHGAGRRPGRDRQRRRQHRLGRRLREAARRAAVGRRGSRPGRVRPRRRPRRRRPTPTSRSAASIATTSAAARSRPTWTRSTARSARSRARLGVDRAEAARGVVRIANNNMINALKLVSVNRGYDPRDFTLVAFGGGGGMHAVALAAELGIRKVVDPARRRRLLGLGHADERPPPRLLRHAPDSA